MSGRGWNQADRVPVLVNTFRIPTRRVYVGRAPAGVDARGVAIVAGLCAAIFACSFVIGRAASPGAPTREDALPSVPVAAGAAMPVRLSSAPSLEIEPHRNPGAATAGARTLARGGLDTTGALGGLSTSRQRLGAESALTPPSPQPPPAPAPPSSPAPREPPTPNASPTAPNGGSSGGGALHPKPPPSAGISFDTSG